MRRAGFVVLSGALLLVAGGCGSGGDNSNELRTQVNALPLSVNYHDLSHSGDGEVIGGTATDKQGASVHFVLSLGDVHYQDPGDRLPDGTLANRGGGTDFGWWIDSNRKASREVALARDRIAGQLIQTLCRLRPAAACDI